MDTKIPSKYKYAYTFHSDRVTLQFTKYSTT